MKVAYRENYCSPDQIQIKDLPIPAVASNELLIQVFATTVNRTDCANLTGKPAIMRLVLGLFKPRKATIGTDFSGIVKSVGTELSEYQISDRVFGFTDIGLSSQAQYLKIKPSGQISKIPDNINFQQAAASIEGAHYAYSFIHKTKISKGNKILINGATGAIGSALLQFVKLNEVEITVTCPGKYAELVKSLGADQVIDYEKTDFTKSLSTEKFDFIFDTVGKSSFKKCKPLLNKNGTYISSELGAYNQNLLFAITTKLRKGKQVIFPIPFPISQTLPYIKEQLKNGKYHPLIEKEFETDEISNAYKHAMSGQKIGNIILKWME